MSMPVLKVLRVTCPTMDPFFDIVMFASQFHSLRCGSIAIKCNNVADYLADRAIKGDVGIWLEDPPEDLEQLLIDDLVS